MKNHLYGIIVLAMALLLISACVPGSPVQDSGKGTATGSTDNGPTGKTNAPSPWEQTVSEAKKEGGVRVYGLYTASVREAVGAGFKKKYGIDVEFVAGKGPEITTKYLAEERAGLHFADTIIVGAETIYINLKPTGTVASPEKMLQDPQVLDPKAWLEGHPPYGDKDHVMIPLTGAYRTYTVINTDMVKPGDLKSYRDFLDPKWKGKITLFDPTMTGSANTFTTLMLQLYGLDGGRQYLMQLAQQEPAIVKDARLHVEWVAKGKYPIGIGAGFPETSSFIDVGAPVMWFDAQEGGVVDPGGSFLTVPVTPAHPNGAKVMVNWLLDPDGQRVFSLAFGGPPVRLGVSTEGLDASSIPKPGAKQYYKTEEFLELAKQALAICQDIFGPRAR